MNTWRSTADLNAATENVLPHVDVAVWPSFVTGYRTEGASERTPTACEVLSLGGAPRDHVSASHGREHTADGVMGWVCTYREIPSMAVVNFDRVRSGEAQAAKFVAGVVEHRFLTSGALPTPTGCSVVRQCTTTRRYLTAPPVQLFVNDWWTAPTTFNRYFGSPDIAACWRAGKNVVQPCQATGETDPLPTVKLTPPDLCSC